MAAEQGNISWWDANHTDSMNWTSRIPVTLTEHKNTSRVNEPVTLRLHELFGYPYNYSGINPNSFRVIDPTAPSDEISEINGNDIPSQIDHTDGISGLLKDDLLVFLSNVPANSQKTYYVYYSRDPLIPKKSYQQITWNLVNNSGFESGAGSTADNWLSVGSGYSRISGTAHSGTYSVKMTSTDITNNFGLRQFLVVSPSKNWETITIGGWMKADNVSGYRDEGNAIYTDTYYDPSGALNAKTTYFDTGTHGWQFHELTIQPTNGVKEIIPYIYFKGHSGTVWVDDISIYPCAYSVTMGTWEDSGIQIPEPPNPAAIHPRLYFSAADLPALKAKIQQPPTSATWNTIKILALTFNAFPADINDTDAPRNVWKGLRYTAFYYALTGDTIVGNKGKTWLLQICAWPSWTPPTSASGNRVNYETGKIAIAAGEAYDMLCPLLTETERATVRQAILEKAVKPAYLDYADWSYLVDARSNRAAQGYGGIGVATLAILGDGANTAELEYYLSSSDAVIKEYLSAYDPDGAWPEGVGYQSYGLCDASGALYYLEAVKRVRGENLYSIGGFSHAMDYPLYMLPPDRKSASNSFGDTDFRTGFSAGAIEALSNAHSDGFGMWYLSNGPVDNYDDIPNFIWSNASIPVLSPSFLPQSKLFRGVGVAVMRTGWNLTDLMMSFRSGPIFPGHNRPEQNSFTLDAFGERLIVEPGMPASGYTDPNYLSYYAATISQNTILINGDPHSQVEENIDGNVNSKPAGVITETFNENFFNEVVGDAKDAYPGKLSKFNRHIVFIKPDYVIILDDLASANGPVEFDSLWHTLGTNSIAVSGDNITITRNGVTLYARAFIPSFTYSIGSGQPYNLDTGAIPTSYIKMYSSIPSSSASYLYVLSPVQGTGPAHQVTKIQNGSVTGVKIQQNDFTDIVLFNPSGNGISCAGVSTDGNKAYIRYQNGNITRFAMLNGKTLSYNGTSLFSTSTKTSVATQVMVNTPNATSKTGVYRPSAHSFYLKNGTAVSWTTTAINWGTSTDLPVTGDWNGDGITDIGVYRPSAHSFYLKNGTAVSWTTTAINWGTSTDLPVTGDWNGDKITDIGVYRPSAHTFYLKNGTAVSWTTTAINWGTSTDLPVTGDWNEDGMTDIGVYRPSIHTFYLKNGTALSWTTTAINWGTSMDLPVTGKW